MVSLHHACFTNLATLSVFCELVDKMVLTYCEKPWSQCLSLSNAQSFYFNSILFILFSISQPVLNALDKRAVGGVDFPGDGECNKQLFFSLVGENWRGKHVHSFPTDELGLPGEGR